MGSEVGAHLFRVAAAINRFQQTIPLERNQPDFRAICIIFRHSFTSSYISKDERTRQPSAKLNQLTE